VAKPSKTRKLSKLFKKLPPQLRTILGGLGSLMLFGLAFLGLQLFMMLLVVMLEVPWVASAVLLGIFLIALIPSNGWTQFGAYLFMVGAVVSAFLDTPGNPIYNAPFEALFLSDGEYLSGHAIVETPSRGETVISGQSIIVDAEGNKLRDISGLFTFLYRLVLYSVIYGTLITLRGFLPKIETTSTSTSSTRGTNGSRKRNKRDCNNSA
jgi:hypothetical protein